MKNRTCTGWTALIEVVADAGQQRELHRRENSRKLLARVHPRHLERALLRFIGPALSVDASKRSGSAASHVEILVWIEKGEEAVIIMRFDGYHGR